MSVVKAQEPVTFVHNEAFCIAALETGVYTKLIVPFERVELLVGVSKLTLKAELLLEDAAKKVAMQPHQKLDPLTVVPL